MTPTDTSTTTTITTPRHRRQRAVAGLAVAACAAALLAACGDEAEAAVCEPYLGVTEQFNTEPDPATLGTLLDQVDEEAPEDLAESLSVMTGAARQVLDSGGEDFAAFETPEFAEAQGEVDPWMFENCDFDGTEEATATEYEFEGLPDEMDAGTTAILLTNEGEEAHELAIMRKKEGVTQSWDEILALPQEEGQALVDQVGGAFAPREGTKGLAVVELTEGEYVAACFVPTGTSMAADGAVTEGTGVPHFMGGMVHEFTVSA